jgi:hypothetical protein
VRICTDARLGLGDESRDIPPANIHLDRESPLHVLSPDLHRPERP